MQKLNILEPQSSPSLTVYMIVILLLADKLLFNRTVLIVPCSSTFYAVLVPPVAVGLIVLPEPEAQHKTHMFFTAHTQVLFLLAWCFCLFSIVSLTLWLWWSESRPPTSRSPLWDCRSARSRRLMSVTRWQIPVSVERRQNWLKLGMLTINDSSFNHR